MTRVAVVGSRGYPRMDLVAALIRRLHAHDPGGYTIVSGTEPASRGRAAPGVDETAIAEARRLGLPTVVYPADWKSHGKRAGHLRNVSIIENSDAVVGFWDLRSRGSADSLDMALRRGTLRKVYGPDGDEVGMDVVGEALRRVLG